MTAAARPLRIIVCTKRDLAGALVLNHVLPKLAGDEVMVLLSDKTRPVENNVPELAEIKFLERDLPIDTIFPLVDQSDHGDGRFGTFQGLAKRYGVPIKTVTDINAPQSEQMIRDFAPDLILSARFSLIFKSNVFDIPRFGTFNVHPGALPRFAGLFAPFRCMVEGRDAIGCTLHKVDSGIDTGPLYGIGWLPVRPEKSLLWHVVNTYGPGLDLFFAMLNDVRAGRAPELQVQDRSQRAYGSLPDARAFREFAAQGYRLFSPTDYLEILQDFVPTAMRPQIDHLAHRAASTKGAPCCCEHA
jgi:hypothetical protein